MPRAKPGQQKQKTRPLIHIDWGLVDQLLMAQCPGTMIASYFGVCADTLYDRCRTDKGVCFSQYSALKKDKGKAEVMMKHYSNCMKEKERSIEKFGEQYLGWSNKVEQKIIQTIEMSQKAILELPDNGKQPKSNSTDRTEEISPSVGPTV